MWDKFIRRHTIALLNCNLNPCAFKTQNIKCLTTSNIFPLPHYVSNEPLTQNKGFLNIKPSQHFAKNDIHTANALPSSNNQNQVNQDLGDILKELYKENNRETSTENNVKGTVYIRDILRVFKSCFDFNV